MAKRFPTATLDGLLDVIAAGDKIVVCSAEPTTFAEANATFLLAGVVAVPVTDFTKAAGSPTGRKVTVAAKNGVSVTATGTATHVAVIRTADSTLRAVTTCTSQALTSGNTVNIPAHAYTVVDPV